MPNQNSNKDTQSISDGAACGGVVSESMISTGDPWGYMMSMVMPDEPFARYAVAKNSGNEKEAQRLFKKYAWSLI